MSVGLCAEERRHCRHPEVHRLLGEPELPKIDETCFSIEGANVYLAGANPRRSARSCRAGTVDAACQAWNRFIALPNAIASIGMRDWARIGQ